MLNVEQAPAPSVLAAIRQDMAHCSATVREDVIATHGLVLTRISAAGTWWTGVERLAIAAAARSAPECDYCEQRKVALSPHGLTGTHLAAPPWESELPVALIDLIHLVRTDATRTTAQAIRRLSDAGLSDAHYIEALGIVVAIASIDQTCRGLGVPLHQLPNPVSGQPSQIRPAVEDNGEAFVPMLAAQQPNPPNDDLWDEQSIFYGLRAMSLVPDAVRDLRLLSAAHYLPLDKASDFSYQRALSRAQMEVLATRVSALNDCFY